MSNYNPTYNYKHIMHHLHSSYNHPVLREYVSQLPTTSQLIYPIFVSDRPEELFPMESLPGQFRYGYESVARDILPLVQKGLKSVLIFGVVVDQEKDERGSLAYSQEGPTQKAVATLRKHFSRDQLLIITDCCLCGFRKDGNCGVFQQKGSVMGQGQERY